MVEPLHIQTLGRFRVLRGKAPVPDNGWGTHRAKVLLKVLLTHFGQSLLRDQIIEWVWPDAPPEAATRALYTAVSDLRRALEPSLAKPADSAFVVTADEGYRLSSEAVGLTLDKQMFARQVEVARETAAQHSLHASAPAYAEAEALYAGDYLPEDLYADWSVAERERLRAMYLTMMLESAGVHAQVGRYREAIAKCRRVLEVDNCLESAYRALMLYYQSAGERPQALRVYAECQVILQRELGVAPMAETTALFNSIVGIGSASTEKPVTNLPIALTSFVGRKREMVQVKKSLRRTRLLTLTGAGGSGKTRLALQVANDLIDAFQDGVWWVELAALSDEWLVTRAVAKVLGVFEQSQQPLDETLQAHLRSKHLLLVLDNCEHLISACGKIADELLRSAPDLRILATSREAIGLTGEMLWSVPPLSLPDRRASSQTKPWMQYEAIRLFVERAVAVNQRFTLTPRNAPAVLQVCQRLDGMPLAIELAAACVKTLPPEQIAARLARRFSLLTGGSRAALPRHQTLRAALDWSYNLLSQAERTLWQRLSVFAGGWTLAGATAVCAEGESSGDEILDLLTHLVDKSLVVVDPQEALPRHRLLETIREYALEKLQASGEFEAQSQRQLDYFTRFAEAAQRYYSGAEESARLDQLETEHDNLRASLEWCLEHDPPSGLRLAIALWQFWVVRGYLVEGRERLQDLLAKAPARTLLRAKALLSLVAVGFRLERLAAGVPLTLESLSIFQELGDKSGSSLAYQWLGAVALVEGEYDRARSALETSLALARAAGFNTNCAVATHFLGVVSEAEGDYRRAKTLMEQSLALFRELDDQPDVSTLFINAVWVGISHGRFRTVVDEETILLLRQVGTRSAIGYALANLGMVARAEGDYLRAKGLLEEGLAEFRAIGDRAGIGQVLSQLGNLARVTGEHELAKTLLEASLDLRRELGDRRGIGRTFCSLGNLATAEGNYAQAREYLSQGLQLFQKMRDKPGLAAAFSHLGNAAMAEGDLAQARLLYTRGYDLFAELGTWPWVAVMLLNLADCERLSGDYPLARTRLEGSLAAFRKIGYRPGIALAQRKLRGLARGSRPATRDNPYALTAREVDVLACLTEGHSNREIGRRLSVSTRTVEHHVASILLKLDVRSRHEAIAMALKRPLLRPQ